MARIQFTFETLLNIESKYPVNKLMFDDIHVWPLLRMLLVDRLLGRISNNETSSLPLRVKKFLSPILNEYSITSVNKQLRSLPQGAVDTVFLSNADVHQDKFQGKAFDRNIDPWLRFFSEQGEKVLKIELRNQHTSSTQPRFEDTNYLSLPFSMLVERFMNRIGQDTFKQENEEFAKFVEAAKKIDGLEELSLRDLVYEISVFHSYTIFFDEVVTYLKPKRMCFVDFCSLTLMALTHVCKKHRVTTFDLQHGAQGDYQGYYAPWTQIPPGGYSVLPDFFWCWDKMTFQRILDYRPNGNINHRPIVGGNLWLSNWVNNEGYPLSTAHNRFLDELKIYERVILFSVSDPIDEPIPEILIKAINKTPGNWLWLIRLHPQMKNQKNSIEVSLQARRDIKINIDEATDIPLFALLKHTACHLTCTSSVGTEAFLFNVPTVVLHPQGKLMYEPFIKAGAYAYIPDDTDRLIEIIKEPIGFNKPPASIEVAPKFAKEAYNKIVSHSRERGERLKRN